MGQNTVFGALFISTLIVLQFSIISAEPFGWKNSIKDYWPFNLINKEEPNTPAPPLTAGFIVQVAPHYPVWKIHKYSGVQFKPVSTIPTFKFGAYNGAPKQPSIVKHDLPPLEDIQNILGTGSLVETVDTLRELASTDDGRSMMVDYIKTSHPDTNISEKDIISAINHYQLYASKGIQKPSEHLPKSPVQSTYSYIKNILKSSPDNGLTEKKPEINNPFVVTSPSNSQTDQKHSFFWYPKNIQYPENRRPFILKTNKVIYQNPGIYRPAKEIISSPSLLEKVSEHSSVLNNAILEPHFENTKFNIPLKFSPIIVAEDSDVSKDEENGDITGTGYFVSSGLTTQQSNENSHIVFKNKDTHDENKVLGRFTPSSSTIKNNEVIDKHAERVEKAPVLISNKDVNIDGRPVNSLKYEFPNFSYTQLNPVIKHDLTNDNLPNVRNRLVKENTSPGAIQLVSPKNEPIKELEDYFVPPMMNKPVHFSNDKTTQSGFNTVLEKNNELKYQPESYNDIPTKFPFFVTPNGIEFDQVEKNSNPSIFTEKEPLRKADSQFETVSNKKSALDQNKFPEVSVIQHETSINGRPVNALNFNYPNLSYTQLSEIPLSNDNAHSTNVVSSYDVPISGYEENEELLPAASDMEIVKLSPHLEKKIDQGEKIIDGKKESTNNKITKLTPVGNGYSKDTTIIYASSDKDMRM